MTIGIPPRRHASESFSESTASRVWVILDAALLLSVSKSLASPCPNLSKVIRGARADGLSALQSEWSGVNQNVRKRYARIVTPGLA